VLGQHHSKPVTAWLCFCALVVISGSVSTQAEVARRGGAPEVAPPQLVELEISFGPSSEIIHLSLVAGRGARVRDTEFGYAFLITPKVSGPEDVAAGELDIEIAALDDDLDSTAARGDSRVGADVRGPRILDSFSGKVGFVSYSAKGLPGPIAVRVVSVGPAGPLLGGEECGSATAASSTQGVGHVPDDDTKLRQIDFGCCVTCGTTTACGCAVSMSCGTCCSCGLC